MLLRYQTLVRRQIMQLYSCSHVTMQAYCNSIPHHTVYVVMLNIGAVYVYVRVHVCLHANCVYCI